MDKPKLSKLAKARIDPLTKQQLGQLTFAFSYQDEADTIRAAFREFIQNHREALPHQDALPPPLARRPTKTRSLSRFASI